MKLGNRRGDFRVARSSRALVAASRGNGLLSRIESDSRTHSVFHVQKSSFRRDAETNARDERATRILLPHFNHHSL